jgi:tRNA A37 threonylcarbamoyladenosine modification protein TsaB
MILSINPLLPEISCIVIDDHKTIDTSTVAKNLDTASTLPRHIVDLVDKHGIDEIWCVTGPGPFTLMRVVTLTCNTLAIARSIRLKSAHFFDMISPWHIAIIEANPKECIIRKWAEESLRTWDELPLWTYEWILTTKELSDDKTWIQYSENTETIKHVFESKEYLSALSPIYFKAPHITWSSKNTSPFSGPTNESWWPSIVTGSSS